MTQPLESSRLEAAYQTALAALLAERTPDGHWVGELSSSALSTATAVSSLALVQKHTATSAHQHLIDAGLAWLAAYQNADGGWGDTVKSLSNISTSMLCRAALHLTGTTDHHREPLQRVETWLFERYGNTPAQLAEAVRQRYGVDRTFSVPILTTCALAGLVSWDEVPPLPFELACFPQSWFRFLRLHVVSYALPALIAIGQCVHQHKRKSWNFLSRLIRWVARGKSLRVLRAIQPSSGGYLEATPLTSFVTLSLASIGHADHPVAREAVRFLVNSARPDGSWAIDTNLATWVTTLSVNALSSAGEHLDPVQFKAIGERLLTQQYKTRHRYTGAAPGGWAWTDLPGGVPDADDTGGALLAFRSVSGSARIEVTNGVAWLMSLQNQDGGWPTFCRGWGHLPFDRSGADLTAHSLRALAFWRRSVGEGIFYDKDFDEPGLLRINYLGSKLKTHKLDEGVKKGLNYLARTQRPDGSWLPLWFGNQHAPDDTNPTYGTARVLAAYRDLGMMDTEPAQRGVRWLLDNQNDDSGWGGCKGCPSSIEETSLAVEVLLDTPPNTSGLAPALNSGLAWLVEQVESGGLKSATPIGFYFAKLWYFEKLYPMIFAVAALGRARRRAVEKLGAI